MVGWGSDYANWILPLGYSYAKNIAEASVALFTGGEDVSPAMYGRKAHPYTGNNIRRDLDEQEAFIECIKHNKKMIGICRGSQFLCVMAGGILVQHQENNSFMHPVTTNDARTIITSSTHHQAQYPWNMKEDNYKVLAWSTGLSRFHEDGDRSEMVDGVIEGNKECEIVYYPKIQALGIQGHPEMVYPATNAKTDEFIKYCQELFINLMDEKI